MKFRIAFVLVFSLLLSACQFTLAEDVTPPPGYIAPTPVPTLGQLYPARAPSVENGAAIYAEKCLPCHGETGMGDGPQGIQLNVTVSALGLPEIARPASPAQWYTTVTRGNIERFMPPFASLNDQERWDVVAFAMTLHTTKEQIQQGKELFESNCLNCSTDFFKDQAKMSALSAVDLARIVRLGNDTMKAFGEKLSDDEMWAVAAYLRTLSFDTAPLAQATARSAPATESQASAETTPLASEQAPAVGEATSVPQKGFGSVSGSVENKTGAALPADLPIILRGFEHDLQDPNTGPQEVISLSGSIASDGSFVFENVELPENRIFIAEVTHSGIALKSEPVIVTSGQTSIDLPPLVLYEVTSDTSALVVDELNIFLDASDQTKYQLLALYTFRNSSEMMIKVLMDAQQEIPFLKFPLDAEGLGYEALQDSAPFLSMDGGFAMPPAEQPYGILAFSSFAKEKELSIIQPLVLPVTVARIFIPDGMELKGDQLTQESSQTIQGTVYQSYAAKNLNAGDLLEFEVSGSSAPSDATGSTAPSAILIGAGGLGIALLFAGAWMYLRDRNRVEESDDDDEDEFESSEEVMDAIIALDDLHRAKKISDEAYRKRRAELKEVLKELM